MLGLRFNTPPPPNKSYVPPLPLPNKSTHVHAIHGSLLLIFRWILQASIKKFTIYFEVTASYIAIRLQNVKKNL